MKQQQPCPDVFIFNGINVKDRSEHNTLQLLVWSKTLIFKFTVMLSS